MPLAENGPSAEEIAHMASTMSCTERDSVVPHRAALQVVGFLLLRVVSSSQGFRRIDSTCLSVVLDFWRNGQ